MGGEDKKVRQQLTHKKLNGDNLRTKAVREAKKMPMEN